MKFVSTRNAEIKVSVREAIQNGLAVDGGLYVPEKFPHFKVEDFDNTHTHAEVAFILLAPFFAEDLTLSVALKKICDATFQFPIPLTPVPGKPNDFILELFHGPTSAFKDVGARFLANVLEQILGEESACLNVDSQSPVNKSPQLDTRNQFPSKKRRTVLVATSGDTGGAVAGAFFGKTGIEVAILYPEGKISARQEKQLCAWGGNIHAFAVKGTFDDCQKIVKETLKASHTEKTGREWLSANSINLGRILPQMVYYAHAALKLKSASFMIPSGNLGNSLAAVWAKKIGLPIHEIHLALNANHGVVDFFKSGNFTVSATVPTLANAMDVSNPSNLERLRNLYLDLTELKKFMDADSVSDSEIEKEIQSSEKEWGQVLCPHTAVAAVLRKRELNMNFPKSASIPHVIVATAHPAKFESIVEPLIGHAVEIPEALAKILLQPSRVTKIDPTTESFLKAIQTE